MQLASYSLEKKSQATSHSASTNLMDSTTEKDENIDASENGAHSSDTTVERASCTKHTMEVERTDLRTKSPSRARVSMKCCKRRKRLLIYAMLLVHYMLYNVAFSMIGPFFPKVVSIIIIIEATIQTRMVITNAYFGLYKAAANGASAFLTGLIAGVCPLCVAVLSPVFGYFVSDFCMHVCIVIYNIYADALYII